MKIDPNGKIPPRQAMTDGSMNQRVLGMGRGTALTLQGGAAFPDMLRPRIVPMRLSGRITNNIIHSIATLCKCKMSARLGSNTGKFCTKSYSNLWIVL